VLVILRLLIMKPSFLVISLFICALCMAQPDFINRSLTDSTLNYLYIGVDNAVELTGYKHTQFQVTISGGGGSVMTAGSNRYIIRVSTIDTCTLAVRGNNGKEVLQKKYLTRLAPSPVASLAGSRDTVISRSRVLLNPYLSVILPGSFFRSKYRVILFIATFIQDNDSIGTTAMNNLLSSEQVKIIKTLKSRDQINFDEIRALGPDGRSEKLPPFWIRIQ
jgi:hypothetical protein